MNTQLNISLQHPLLQHSELKLQLNEETSFFSLLLELPYPSYQKIKQAPLFQLQKELCTKTQPKPFQQKLPIQIQLILEPELLKSLEVELNQTKDITQKLEELFQENPKHKLFNVDNWIALKVQQNSKQGMRSYRTMWDFCDWEAFAKEEEEDVGTITFNGFTAFAEANGLGKAFSEALSDELLSTNLLKQFFSSNSKSNSSENPLVNAFNQILEDAVGDTFETEESPPKASPDRLFQQLIRFLVEEDWGFSRATGYEEVRIDFQGEHLRWICAARVLQESRYLLFYSYYPKKIEPEQVARVQQFVNRANFDMVNGNFEFKEEQGLLRYKTSLWAERDQVSTEAFRQLIFTNVNIVDDYFGVIFKMLEEELEVEEAIDFVE